MLGCCELEKYVRFLWENEAVPETKLWSLEELDCEEHYVQTHSRDENGRYVVRLPFKKERALLGDSRPMA